MSTIAAQLFADSGEKPAESRESSSSQESGEREPEGTPIVEKPAKKKEKSILFDSFQEEIEKEEGAKRDDKKESESEQEAEPVKKPFKPDWDGTTPLTDAELLNLELQNRDGRPISAQSAKAFNALKERIKTLNREIETKAASNNNNEVTQKLTALETQLAEREAKLKELQEQVDNEYFESSPGFEETYKKPVTEAVNSLKTYFKKMVGDEYADDRRELSTMFDEAAKFATAGDRAEFLEAMDSIAEKFLQGGTALKTAFIGDAKDFYVAHNALAKALQEKGGDRQKLVESKIAELRSKSKIGIERDIARHIQRFEAEQASFMESVGPDMATKFKSLYQESDKETRQLLTEFSATGRVPEKLHDIIARGVTYKAVEANGKVAWAALQDAGNKNTILKKKIAELETKLARYTGEPVGRQQSAPPPNRNGDKAKHKSAIMNELSGILGD